MPLELLERNDRALLSRCLGECQLAKNNRQRFLTNILSFRRRGYMKLTTILAYMGIFAP